MAFLLLSFSCSFLALVGVGVVVVAPNLFLRHVALPPNRAILDVELPLGRKIARVLEVAFLFLCFTCFPLDLLVDLLDLLGDVLSSRRCSFFSFLLLLFIRTGR